MQLPLDTSALPPPKEQVSTALVSLGGGNNVPLCPHLTLTSPVVLAAYDRARDAVLARRHIIGCVYDDFFNNWFLHHKEKEEEWSVRGTRRITECHVCDARFFFDIKRCFRAGYDGDGHVDVATTRCDDDKDKDKDKGTNKSKNKSKYQEE